MRLSLKEPLVLTLFPNVKGFTYALFESMYEPADWGSKMIRSGGGDCFEKMVNLIELFQPSAVVVRSCNDCRAQCSVRIMHLICQVKAYVREQNISLHAYSRTDIRRCFSSCYGAQNKDEIAREIAKLLPEFKKLVPPMRRYWDREYHRMGLFDALALSVTYYWDQRLQPQCATGCD